MRGSHYAIDVFGLCAWSHLIGGYGLRQITDFVFGKGLEHYIEYFFHIDMFIMWYK